MWRLVSALGVCVGCFHPNAADNVPCTADLTCPDGQKCDTSQNPPVCVFEIHDASVTQHDDAAIDAPPMGCVTTADCTNLAVGVCDQTTHTCRGCLQDSECLGHVCVESTAACVDPSNALFVAPTGSDASTCFTEGAPCLSITGALNKLTGNRRTIRVADGTYTESWVFGTSNPVVISGTTPSSANTTVNFAATGFGTGTHDHVVESSGTPLTLEGITFENATNEGVRLTSGAAKSTLFAVAIRGSVGGIDCNNCDLTLVRSTVGPNTGIGIAASGAGPILHVERCNVHNNAGVGLALNSSTYNVTNTFVVDNNDGGVTIDTPGANSHFQFNTIANNTSATLPVGVRCATATALSNTIVANNGAAPQIAAGTCNATYSLFDDATGAPGTGNRTGAPVFANTGDYHIKNGSVARSNADPGATLNVDYDGETRPQGARDIGADEIP
jgi:hypothetical protein